MRDKTTCLIVMVMAWAISAQANPLNAFGVQQPQTTHNAPLFSLQALNNSGKHRLSDERGKVVLLHFWATWCVACRHEMPQIEALWRKYRDRGLVVLGVNVDRGNRPSVRAFVQKRNLSFPFVLDPDGNVRNQYEVRALPTSYLINRKGTIIGRIIGERNWASPEAQSLITDLVK